MKNSGIYLIINLINGMIYVGSAVDFIDRWRRHLKDLNRNLHPNNHLQFAWNKYGPDAFQFTIVEIVEDIFKLIEMEQLWINASNCFDRKIGYNICKIADNRKGIKNSEETNKKISLSNMGRVVSNETRDKIAEAHRGKVKNYLRKSDKWPCRLGIKCKCELCLEEKRKDRRLSYLKKNFPNELEYSINSAHNFAR